MTTVSGKAKLIVVEEQIGPQRTTGERCFDQFIFAIKITSLILLTYGLMIGDFALCLAIQQMNGGIAASYIDAGAIILGIFVFEVICWGIAWCWGARKRDGLRRSIVEAQLARQRAIEQAEEAREEEAERQLLENKRNQR